ncbi:efflux RND transporter periplasmic adaptor subunit [Vibrio sp. ZSDE26]|uniref:Efflux RND transporter periplasmic adaptor subunit n=1 Tax=Vibrio amylolyticus TaxID=2847292 RepID=A0A9X1XJC4_9VIBR|nr:efflux RND transporter periplasmic adaptor subunit [Vibrio amylolyticus]MCK6264062.1 efflux RND transporter periplasmic adaptor subunit [Vibrio amylolyticus]
MTHLKTILCGAILLSLTACNQTNPTAIQTIEPQMRPLQVVKLTDSSTLSTKHFNGVVYSQEQASLSFRVPGTVETILVNRGDQVKKGQVIAKLDPHDYQLIVAELESKMIEANAAHNLAIAEKKRIEQAIADDAISSVSLDRAISGYERSLSAVKVVNKNIQRAKDTVGYTILTAPFDGVIGDISVEPFEQVLPGIPSFKLHNTDLVEVNIDVPENMIQYFNVGHTAQVSWHRSEQSYDAVVSEMATMPNRIKQTYTVTFAIDTHDAQLFPGKSVTVKTQVGDTNNAFCLPYSALVGEDQSLHVNVVRDSIIDWVPVTIETIDAQQACVSGQLNRGDVAVISGAPYLQHGDVVSHTINRDL